MTLKEIAAEAGVSISTVSRVLNQPNSRAASPPVQEKIWEIVRSAGYSPNPAARELKQQLRDRPIMRSIYCLIARPPEEVKDDPFYAQMTASIEQEAFQNHFILKYTFSILDLDNPTLLRQMKENEQDSLIIIGRFHQEVLETLKKKFNKIMYVGLNNLDAACDQVICDGYLAIQEAIRYLRGLRHERIGFIGAEPEERRHQGYLDGIRQAGLPFRPEYVVSSKSLSMDGGYRGMCRLLDQTVDVTAVICANDMIAVGALQACRMRGIRVPQDISLIGMNDSDNVRYVQPTLTSIHVPIEDMGRMAVHILIDRINGGHKLPIKVSFPFYIAERESCAPLKRDADTRLP